MWNGFSCCGFSEDKKLKLVVEARYYLSSQDPGWHICVSEGINYVVSTKLIIMIKDKAPERGLNVRDS